MSLQARDCDYVVQNEALVVVMGLLNRGKFFGTPSIVQTDNAEAFRSNFCYLMFPR